MDSSLEQMFHRVLRALEGVRYESKNTPVFAKALEWISSFPKELEVGLKRRLIDATCRAFNLTEAELFISLDGGAAQEVGPTIVPIQVDPETALRKVLPKGGWFQWYDDYTKGIEVPLSYSIFSSLSALGAALGRRVYLRMGHFNIWPNYCVILIGPPGIKKTTAGDISTALIKEAVLCPVLADQVTPESMIPKLKESGHHLIYAGEMSVFFGKQKYNEGLVTKMLRILDSPSEFIVSTIARGDEVLTDLAVTFLGCTTPSLLGSSMPDQVSSSGFMSRFVLVTEKECDREFPIPEDPPLGLKPKLLATLRRLKAMSGEMSLSAEAMSWYYEWYSQHKKRMKTLTDDTMAEVIVRVPIHLLRTAMLVHLVQCDSFCICRSCMETAAGFMEYVAKSAPETVQSLKQTSTANDMDYVKATLIKLGGAADHSTLVRRVASRMNTAILKQHIRTLEEGGHLKTGKKGGANYYIITKGEL